MRKKRLKRTKGSGIRLQTARDLIHEAWRKLSDPEVRHLTFPALRTLNNAGFNIAEALLWVELYASACDRPSFARVAKQLRSRSLRIEELKEDIEAINEAIAQMMLIAPRVDIAKELDRYIKFLRLAANLLVAPAEVQAKHAVVVLALLVEASTGKKHYREIAELLAARADGGKYQDPGDLGHMVRNFKKDNPVFYDSLKHSATVTTVWFPTIKKRIQSQIQP